MTAAAIVTIDIARRRHDIEAQYQECIKAWREQYEVAALMLKSELIMKCEVGRSIRDSKLRELEGQPAEWPQWHGAA